MATLLGLLWTRETFKREYLIRKNFQNCRFDVKTWASTCTFEIWCVKKFTNFRRGESKNCCLKIALQLGPNLPISIFIYQCRYLSTDIDIDIYSPVWTSIDIYPSISISIYRYRYLFIHLSISIYRYRYFQLLLISFDNHRYSSKYRASYRYVLVDTIDIF